MLGHWVTESGLGGGRVGPGGVTASWWAAVGVQVVACGNLLKFWTQNLRWVWGKRRATSSESYRYFAWKWYILKKKRRRRKKNKNKKKNKKNKNKIFSLLESHAN